MLKISDKEVNHPSIAIQYQTPQRVYKIFKDFDEFDKDISKYNCAYEYISKTQHCKGFLDIEYGREELPSIEKKKLFLSDVRRDLMIVYKKYYNYNLKESQIKIYCFSRDVKYQDLPFKISYHVIVNGIFFKSLKDVGDLYNNMINLNSDYKKVLDGGIYKSCGFMRLPMKQKLYGDNFKLTKIRNISYYTLTNYNNEKFIEVQQNKQDKKCDDVKITKKLSEKDYKLVLDLLNLLPNKYKEKYDKWLSIGIILFNICNIDGLNLWKDFSKGHKSYNAKICEDKYNSFKGGEMGIGTLIFYIKKGVNQDKLKDFLNKNKGFLDKYKDTPEDIIYKCIENELMGLCENQKFDINTISKNSKNQIVATLNDKYCSTCKIEHKGGCNSVIVSNEMAKFCCTETPEIRGTNTQINYLTQVNNYYTTNYITTNNDDVADIDEIERVSLIDDVKLNECVYVGLDNSHKSQAILMYYLYNKIFVYDDEKWHEYANHHWERLNNDLGIKRCMNNLEQYYKTLLKYYKSNDNKKVCKLIKTVILSLRNASFKSLVISECREYFNDSRFLDKLDKNRNLLCFENGVLDLDDMKFRDGVPSDYLSVQLEYEYKSNKGCYYDDVVKFFKDIMPNDDDNNYLKKLLGCSLNGDNLDQIFNIWTGSGANGKSMINKLLKLVLGAYFSPVNSTTLTSMPMSDKGCPEVLVLKNTRLLSCQEPSDKRKINTELVKKITGGDELSGRYLNSNKIIEFVCHLQLIFSCNDIPDLDKMDGGMIRRLRILNFPTKFVDNPTKGFELKIDKSLSNKMENWNSDMLIWLLEGLELYRKEGLGMTDNMKKVTTEYKNEQDVYGEFLSLHIEVCLKCNDCDDCKENKECTENREFLSDIYMMFKSWYIENYDDRNIPTMKKFSKEVKKIYEVKQLRKLGKNGKGIENIRIL